MTDPQTAALQALLTRVEAGEHPGDSILALGSQQNTDNGQLAFHGSLDAAKALHDSLLGDGNISTPGYMACIWMSGKASVWDIIAGTSFHGEVNAPSLHAISPARAWLIAILRALIATP